MATILLPASLALAAAATVAAAGVPVSTATAQPTSVHGTAPAATTIFVLKPASQQPSSPVSEIVLSVGGVTVGIVGIAIAVMQLKRMMRQSKERIIFELA